MASDVGLPVDAEPIDSLIRNVAAMTMVGLIKPMLIIQLLCHRKLLTLELYFRTLLH